MHAIEQMISWGWLKRAPNDEYTGQRRFFIAKNIIASPTLHGPVADGHDTNVSYTIQQLQNNARALLGHLEDDRVSRECVVIQPVF